MSTSFRGWRSVITGTVIVITIVMPFLRGISSSEAVVVATTLFTDGFESNNLNNWTSVGSGWGVSSSNPHTGSRRAGISSDTGQNPNELRKNVSTVGYDGISFDYWYLANDLESQDYTFAQWSSNSGNTWNTLFSINSTVDDNTWHHNTHSLPVDAENLAAFRIRFLANLNSSNDFVRIDDVTVSGYAIATPTPTPSNEPTPTPTPSDEPTPTPSPSATPLPGSRMAYGTLIIEKVIRGGTKTFTDFAFVFGGGENDHFNSGGRNEYVRAVGTYLVSEPPTEGFTATFGGDCDEQGQISVLEGQAVTCVITNTYATWQEGDPIATPAPASPVAPSTPQSQEEASSEPVGTLVVQKIIVLSSASFTEFGFTVASQTQQFEADGTNAVSLTPGQYTVQEVVTQGFEVTYSGSCDVGGVVTVELGQTSTCVITNTLAVGGFNPGEIQSTPTPSPTPLATPAPRAATRERVDAGRVSDESSGVTLTPTPEASRSDEPSNDQAAAIGTFLGLDVCSSAGQTMWWITMFGLAIFLMWFGRTRGSYPLLILAYFVIWALWAVQICSFGFGWMPAIMGGASWLVAVPRKS